jgi:hypothetical protein
MAGGRGVFLNHGFIKLGKSIRESQIWMAEPFTRGQAWVDLLLSATYKDSFFYVRGNKVNITRGQCGMSQLTMAERWRWSRGKVKRFLNDLENEQMIEQQTGNLTTIVSICNYEEYQGKKAADEQQTVQQADNRQSSRQDSRRGTLKNNKNIKKEKKDIYTSEFEAFWLAYPAHRRGSKKNAFREWEKISPDLYNKITESVSQRSNSDIDWLKENGQYIPHAERYLKNERWNDVWQAQSQFSETTQRTIQNLQGVNFQ